MPEVKIAALLIANLLWAELLLHREPWWFAITGILAAAITVELLLEILQTAGRPD